VRGKKRNCNENEMEDGCHARPSVKLAGTPVLHIGSDYTPTGNGLVWLSALMDKPEQRPCNKDINPVYQ
jgi:hypothetical protein